MPKDPSLVRHLTCPCFERLPALRGVHRIGAHTCTIQTVPYGTALWGPFPRHFVPGYNRIVSPGPSFPL
jgi:hypothetical protein